MECNIKQISNRCKKVAKYPYTIPRRLILYTYLNYKTSQYFPQKKELQPLLGKKSYRHIKNLIGFSSNLKQSFFKAAMFLIDSGLPNEAIACLEKCLLLGPEDYIIHNYLQFLMYSSPEKYSLQDIYQAHVKWGEFFADHPKFDTYPNTLTLKRRLKIGYTCHFLTNSTSSTLLLPILKAHNKNNMEIFVYSDQDPKTISNETRERVENWRDTHGINNDQFCQLIRRDQIDILLELNGHGMINRYRAITRKPAPIQISYYNYSCTTGIPGIDYTFAAKGNADFSDLQPYYSEKIFVLEGVGAATTFPAHFPPVSPSPFIKNGYITFGSFGQAHKVSRDTIKLWCEVLKRVPSSQFYMKASALDYPENLSSFKKHFEDCGIDRSRIILEGFSDYSTLLKLYSKVDIALDSYPYTSGTTTIEAFIQGVPTISLVGQRYSSRHGYSNLHSVGHDELLAYSKQEYIEKSVDLANDPQRLIHYRQTFRDDYKCSSRVDMETFIHQLECAYTQMWSTYVEEQSLKTGEC